MENKYRKSLKAILLGSVSVGKTCLINRWGDLKYNNLYLSTITLGVRKIPLDLEGSDFDLFIWDTPGDERFKSAIQHQVHGTDGAMIVFDLTNEESFNDIRNWVSFLRENSDCNFIIVRNKDDILDKFPNYENKVNILCAEFSVDYYFTSPLDGYNVDDAFHQLIQIAYEHKSQQTLTTRTTTPRSSSNETKKSLCCF
jgi:small GTP-binding protein